MRQFAILFVGMCIACAGLFAADELDLEIRSDPPVEAIKPNVDAAKLIFQLVKKDGSFTGSAQFHIEMYSPPKNTFFSTGFPIVEGTQLLCGDFTAENGRLELAYLFPIRGAYRIKATAQTGSAKIELDQNFQIREEPEVVRYFSVLMALLVSFGAVSGIVLGRSAFSRASAQCSTAAILAFLLLAAGTGQSASAHEGHPQADGEIKTTDRVEAVSARGDRLEMRLIPELATVGQMAALEGVFIRKEKTGEAVLFTLSFVNLDHNKEIFRTEFQSPDGKFRLQHQFVDGAAHRIELSARPAMEHTFIPLIAEMNIAVHAIHPPTRIVMRTLAFMLGVVALSMGLAFAVTVKLSGRAVPASSGGPQG